MNIRIIRSENFDRAECQDMEINGKRRISVRPLNECPEDAFIGRDLISCEEISELMKEAYDAGRHAEEFSVEVIKEES